MTACGFGALAIQGSADPLAVERAAEGVWTRIWPGLFGHITTETNR